MNIKDKIAKILEIEAAGSARGAKARFCRRIGCKSTASVEDWLSGRSMPNSQYRQAMCREYGVSRAWFEEDEGEMLEFSKKGAVRAGKAPSVADRGSGGVAGHDPAGARTTHYTRSEAEYQDMVKQRDSWREIAASVKQCQESMASFGRLFEKYMQGHLSTSGGGPQQAVTEEAGQK